MNASELEKKKKKGLDSEILNQTAGKSKPETQTALSLRDGLVTNELLAPLSSNSIMELWPQAMNLLLNNILVRPDYTCALTFMADILFFSSHNGRMSRKKDEKDPENTENRKKG